MLQDEVYRITREEIPNAFQHADASHIEVEIRYDDDQLRLRIRDDGKGIDPEILQAGGSSGHWGIPGIGSVRSESGRSGVLDRGGSGHGAGVQIPRRWYTRGIETGPSPVVPQGR